MFTRFVLCVLPLVYASSAAVHFSERVELGRVSSPVVNETSGLAASRVHPGIFYGHNDHGGMNRVFAMDPATGEVKATLNIAGVQNYDWEDVCVGTCGQGESGSCLYIGELGDHHGDGSLRLIYKVREPAVLQDTTLPLVDTLRFTWNEQDAESLMIDPSGDLYIISKLHGGDSLFAKLPRSGWGASTPVPIPSHDTVRLDLNTYSNDPQGADLSPNGRMLLVKEEHGLVFYAFSDNMNYVSELAGMRPTSVGTYVRRKSGEAVAWNVNGTGFYTLPEGEHQVFNFYTISGAPDGLVG
ncbi:uncharacterized protein [Littorina saxatilis]|uniref:Uncharacterized protein n=1 Tax=Littorina saxatilis TaxID=31220 RepID=A0AAN9BQY6_9CAEN